MPLKKHITFQCPNCLKNVELGYRGALQEIEVAGSVKDLRKRRDRPSYTPLLEASNPGDSWLIPKNRKAWFGWACGPWLKRDLTRVMAEEHFEDGSVRFTRTA